MKQIHVILTGILLTSSIGSAESLKTVTSPINPAFLDWQAQQKSDLMKKSVKAIATDNFKTGYIPSPILPVVHKPLSDSLEHVGSSINDAKYDMRDPNNDGDTSDSLLTPIKDQVYSGPCWAFATYGALEGYFKKFHGWEKDFSEDHLTHTHGFDPCSDNPPGSCPSSDPMPTRGGNQWFSMAYLARGGGAISEANDPYDTYDANGDYQSNTSTPCSACTPDRYIDNTIMLPVRSTYTDLDYIKNALVTHGSLFTSMQVTGSDYDSASSSFYYKDLDTSNRETDHGVVIVGWDDNYEMTHGGAMTGAFIIKNSWGVNTGENGYHYVAYEDDSIAFRTLGYFDDKPESELLFDTIYQYDPLGIIGAFGYTDHDDHAANVFTTQYDEKITAIGVGIYFNSNIEIKIYGTVSGNQFSNILATKSVADLETGYYTIVLDTPVILSAGTKFAVAIQYTDNTGEDTSIPIEKPIENYSSGAVASAGQSYYGHNGTSWTDLTEYNENANANIKAFTSKATCSESKLLTVNQWNMISMACNPGIKTVADLFPEFNPNDYSTTWALFDYDAVNEQYNTIGVNEILSSGKGYWFYTDKTDVTLALDGNKNGTDDIPLVSGSEGRMNLLGHPHTEEVEWKDVLIVEAGGTTHSLADANTAGMISNKMYQWKSGSYQVYDGETLGQEGSLLTFDGFWTEVYNSDLSLRIPTSIATASASMPSSLFTMVPEALASASVTNIGTNNDKEDNKEKSNDWFVRLIVESGSLKDPGNVLGQLSDSIDGQDKHDLKEKEPFSSPYLSVVFPHTEWEDSAWGYTTDFHAVNKTKEGSWEFTVKASENISEATLQWEGPEEILKKAILIDKETGKRIKLKKTKSYTFDIINGKHEFIFKTKKQPKEKK